MNLNEIFKNKIKISHEIRGQAALHPFFCMIYTEDYYEWGGGGDIMLLGV